MLYLRRDRQHGGAADGARSGLNRGAAGSQRSGQAGRLMVATEGALEVQVAVLVRF